MTRNATFVFSNDYLQYQFNQDHPFNQQRVIMTKELLESTAILKDQDIIKPRFATDEELLLFHNFHYIEAVKKAGTGKLNKEEGLLYGLGTEDTPIFPNMHEAASLIVGGSLTAIDSVLNGESDHSLNLGGG